MMQAHPTMQAEHAPHTGKVLLLTVVSSLMLQTLVARADDSELSRFMDRYGTAVGPNISIELVEGKNTEHKSDRLLTVKGRCDQPDDISAFLAALQRHERLRQVELLHSRQVLSPKGQRQWEFQLMMKEIEPIPTPPPPPWENTGSASNGPK